MKIHSLQDEEFKSYGRIIHCQKDIKGLKEALNNTPIPEKGTIYEPEDSSLMNLEIASFIQKNLFGGLEIQIGYCSGYNTKLNCLEYHKSSEINFANEDFILLLAKKKEIEKGILDTKKVKAFRVPKDTFVEIYSTNLHYAPCQTNSSLPFQVLVCLPKGTNTSLGKINSEDEEDKYLFMKNKWLLAHKEASEAKESYIGLVGENIDIKDEIEKR